MNNPRPITETQLRFVKPIIKWFSRLNVLIYKISGGRLFNRIGGGDICIVTMTGAKSGLPTEMPLMYIPYQNGIVFVASMGGAPRHPAWYFNLVANPEIEVLVRDQRLQLVARLASAEEKVAVWPLCCQHYPDFERYRRRSSREFPIFICTPKAPSGV